MTKINIKTFLPTTFGARGLPHEIAYVQGCCPWCAESLSIQRNLYGGVFKDLSDEYHQAMTLHIRECKSAPVFMEPPFYTVNLKDFWNEANQLYPPEDLTKNIRESATPPKVREWKTYGIKAFGDQSQSKLFKWLCRFIIIILILAMFT